MAIIQLEIKEDYLDNILNFLKLLPKNVVKIKELSTITLTNKEKYEFWSDKELEYISKIDLSTPLEDDEDYSKW
ncbi:hypothetical protein MNB_SV-15-1013 [hydrothermal vent metagenome]|uniref:Uncharacterized protein n=1 Tax=hydrothermal vent metagenome TaxID=652676 RepID=A0A1W1ELI3_9ZZZZ